MSKRVVSKPASREVVRVACGTCGFAHVTREEADACCLCRCSAPLAPLTAPQRSLGDQCARCRLAEAIRYNRQRLRDYKKAVADADKQLAKLLAEKAALDAEVRS